MNHQHVQIPLPPILNLLPNEWINEIASITKNANKQACKITTKYNEECIKKAISKYRQPYKKNPIKVNKKIFKNNEISLLDYLIDHNNNILISPEDIAHKIHIQQSISNRSIDPTYHYQPNHPIQCMCGNRQYLWDDIGGFTIDKRSKVHTPLHICFDTETYDICIKNLGS